MIDAIGEDGPDPGTGWDIDGVSNATKDHTLIRSFDVCNPEIDWTFQKINGKFFLIMILVT